MSDERNDPVVFAEGTYTSKHGPCEVTLHVPHDVRLSQIMPALAGIVRNTGEAVACDDGECTAA